MGTCKGMGAEKPGSGRVWPKPPVVLLACGAVRVDGSQAVSSRSVNGVNRMPCAGTARQTTPLGIDSSAIFNLPVWL